MIHWGISYRQNGKTVQYECFSKKAIVSEYINLLNTGYKSGISELTMLKEGTDYTATINRFLNGNR